MILGYSSDLWLSHLLSNELYELGDDLVLGILVGIVGSWWLRRRNRAIRHKLNRVANINQLIRNELEVISYSAQATSKAAEIKHIEQSVRQISWILRELLGPNYAAVEQQADTQSVPVAVPSGAGGKDRTGSY
jgi:hypothetical protein